MTTEQIKSEITGTVWKILVAEGDVVQLESELMILESMKMEIPVESSVSGRIKAILVAEGDRLSGNKFFDHVLSLGMDLKIIHFSIDPIISRARAVERGNIYNDSWYKGRVTKIRNTLQRYPSVSIDASQSAQQIALELKNLF